MSALFPTPHDGASPTSIDPVEAAQSAPVFPVFAPPENIEPGASRISPLSDAGVVEEVLAERPAGQAAVSVVSLHDNWVSAPTSTTPSGTQAASDDAAKPAAPFWADLAAKGLVFLALGLCAAVFYMLMYGAPLQPLRAAFWGFHSGLDALDNLIKPLLLAVLVVLVPIIVFGLIFGLLSLGSPRRASQHEMVQALEDGMRQAQRDSVAILDKSLAGMREQGASEQEVAELRAEMEAIQRASHERTRQEMQKYLDHPELIDGFLRDSIADARKNQAARVGHL